MFSMSKAYSIRQLRMEGDSIAEISRKLEVSRDTVYKYLAMEDLSQSESTPIPLAPGGGNENPYLGSRFGGFVRYTFEQRKRAVELYIECGKSVSAVRGKLGYPSRQAMYDWYADYVEHGFRPDHRPHRKFTDEQRRRRRPLPLAREAGRGHYEGARVSRQERVARRADRRARPRRAQGQGEELDVRRRPEDRCRG